MAPGTIPSRAVVVEVLAKAARPLTGRGRPRAGCRIEQGERRLDVVEFYWVAHACGRDPARTVSDLMRQFKRLEGGTANETKVVRKRR